MKRVISARVIVSAIRSPKCGAEAVILGCTEIMLLVRPEDSEVPIFYTTAIHAAAAIDMALAG